MLEKIYLCPLQMLQTIFQAELDEKQRTLYELMEQQKASRERREETLNAKDDDTNRSSERIDANMKARVFLEALLEKIELRERSLKELNDPLNEYVFRNTFIGRDPDASSRMNSDIVECTKKFEAAQSQASKSQQQLDELEESVLLRKTQRAKLERQKARAVDAKQFEIAAKISTHLNDVTFAFGWSWKAQRPPEKGNRNGWCDGRRKKNWRLKDLNVEYLEEKKTSGTWNWHVFQGHFTYQ